MHTKNLNEFIPRHTVTMCIQPNSHRIHIFNKNIDKEIFIEGPGLISAETVFCHSWIYSYKGGFFH